MNKKKILVIGSLPPPTGGMETVMEQMCEFSDSEYQIVPFNVAKNKIIKSNIFFNIINFVYNCIRLLFLILMQKPQIIHIHVSSAMGFWQKAVYFKISKLLRRITILHMHGANFKEWYANVDQKRKNKILNVLNKSDAIIVLSKSSKDFYSKISNNKNIFVINNAMEDIDFEKYRRVYSKNKFIVLFLSRICKRKGVYDLLKTIKSIDNQNIKFVFVGPYENKEKFFKEMERLNIKSKCLVVGEVMGKERLKYFTSADLFILPSYAEGLPVAILEAMSFGLPIVSTTVGAIPEVIEKKNGILISPGNINEMKNAIISIYYNKEKIDYYHNNKTKVKNNYTQKIFQKNVYRIYAYLEKINEI
jgi:glycosyltransferase involved in cell wall biosynthesis